MLFKTLKKGFTLIELLIVIVIIGVLAVAILSAINPIEQINKATDAGRRSDAAELLNGLERYYTSWQEYPWDQTAAADTPPAPLGAVGQVVASADTPPVNVAWLAELINDSEMKTEFQNRDNLQDLFVWYDATTFLVRICFNPVSQSLSNQATWTNQAAPGCDPAAAGAQCFMCVPE